MLVVLASLSAGEKGDQNLAKSSCIVSGGGPLREGEHNDGCECITKKKKEGEEGEDRVLKGDV